MEVFTAKCDENHDKTFVIRAPRQPPLLKTTSDYSIWKLRVATYLREVPTSEHFGYLLSYLDDKTARIAKANGFEASKSPAENWKILDDCFYIPVDTEEMIIRFASRQQKANENPIDYLDSLQLIAFQAFPHLNVERRNELVRSSFVEGLVPGPLKEHFRRMPPVDTVDLKRTAFRYLTAEKLSNSPETCRRRVVAVEKATGSSRLDSFQKVTAAEDFPGRNTRRGQSGLMWNRQSSWNNYQDCQTDRVCSRRFGRTAKRCGHNHFQNSGKPCLHRLSSCRVNHVCPITIGGKLHSIEVEYC
ncbi:unnamed protein product [Schistosoma turkestanicum]|nr:unnamed protein product [Schistosoma turkestanicum]